jgi:hypothetical protein
MKHTPEPWRVKDTRRDEWEDITIWAGEDVLAIVVDDHHGNKEGNANLMAASPTMYTAIEKILAYWDRNNAMTIQIEKLDSYIHNLRRAMIQAKSDSTE